MLDDGLVNRPRLVGRLRESRRAHLALLTAPPGYSKSTTLGQWSVEDERPFGWISATARHDDPAVMVASIVAALDEIDVVENDVLAPLAAPRPSIESVILPRLREWIGHWTRPFVLVIDDLHAIGSRESLSVITCAVDALPPGCQVAIASRAEVQLPLGRIRAERQLVELTSDDLAMTREESGELLRSFDLRLRPDQLDVIFDRTEGWPAALYLAGLSLSDQPDLAAAVRSFAGNDRIVVDYLRDEFLGNTEPERLDFLVRSSILDELSGPLCDSVLERSGSGQTLEEMARSNALVIPLDRHGERYRYHHLFAEMLRSELRRRYPDASTVLHGSASHWYQANGDVDRAIEHAIAAGDPEWAGKLIWEAFPEVLARGRIATLERWLGELGDESIALSPELALTSAHRHLNLGEGDRAAHAARVAAARAEASRGETRGETDSIQADLLLIKGILAVEGMVQVGRDVSLASELHPPESIWQSPCFFFRGVSVHLSGHPERARPLLEEAVRRSALGVPLVEVMALSQLALIALDDHDSEAALRYVTQARDQVSRCGMTDYASVSIAFATSALVEAMSGMTERSHSDLKTANKLLSLLVDLPPWYECEARIAVAGACVRLDDLPGARNALRDAETFLKRIPDAPILNEWLETTRQSLDASAVSGRHREWSLTTAELRTLQYLPSHLSFREIGERIHVSSNTVKTQARAVYRKLDVSSRAEAVEVARQAGLLGDGPPP